MIATLIDLQRRPHAGQVVPSYLLGVQTKDGRGCEDHAVTKLPKRVPLLVCWVVVLAMCGCRTAPERQRTSLNYTDDIGRTVSIRVPAERIVSLAPNLTELIFAAGAGSRLAAVTTADNYPPEVDSLPRISAVPVDFEEILLVQPDLVVATDQVNSPKDARTFESLDIPVYFLRFRDLNDIFRAVEVLGEIGGSADRAKDHASSLRQALADLRARTESVSRRPRVLFLIGHETLFGFGKGNYIHAVIDAAGGTSVSADEELGAPVFSDEYVIEQRPDVIIGSFPDTVDARTLLRLHPAWGTVPAIRDGRVHALNPDIMLRPGPRVIEGAYRLALLLHPALFDQATDEGR